MLQQQCRSRDIVTAGTIIEKRTQFEERNGRIGRKLRAF
jgi:hypothetical protein